ncbi:MAG: beta-lactamase family protein [Clostridia bacterium]|nr:beta-lactamase family protein [Clostridia bacterium]
MRFELIKEFLDRLTAWRIPGAAIVLKQGGKEIFKYSAGYADLENKIPMTGEETLNMYSCSKVVTVVSALQLLERGIFLLDDPLYAFIPEFKDMYVKNENGEIVKAENPITMRHLFTMSAGFSYDLDSEGLSRAKEWTNGKMDTLDAIKGLATEPLHFQPGSRWEYSLCHDVLAAAVEVISGKKFSEYVRENIFAPLGITDISYTRPQSVKDKIAEQYEFIPNEICDKNDILFPTPSGDGCWKNIGKDVMYQLGENYESGGAGLVISVPDYSKFADAMAHFGKCPNGERILSKGGVRLLREDQLTPYGIPGFDWPHLPGYTYGLGVKKMSNIAQGGTIGTTTEFGWDGAAGSVALIDPENEFSVFYSQHLMNCQGPIIKNRVRNVVYAAMNL